MELALNRHSSVSNGGISSDMHKYKESRALLRTNVEAEVLHLFIDQDRPAYSGHEAFCDAEGSSAAERMASPLPWSAQSG